MRLIRCNLMKNKRKIIFFTLIFIFFCTISFLMPLTGDDWGNYLIGINNDFYHRILQSIDMYFSWEGRLVSRILIYNLTCHKFLFNIILSLLITLSIYISGNLIKVKNKNLIYLMMFLAFLLLENTIFTQSILWVAGSITYMFPTLLTFIYLYIYFKYITKNTNYKWYIYLILGLFSLAMTMFVENIAIAFVFLNLLLNIFEYVKTKKINKLLLCNLILSSLGLLLMLVSPGSAQRAQTDKDVYSSGSFLFKIIIGYVRFINYTFIRNYYLVLIISIVNLLIIGKRNRKNLIFRVINYISIFLAIIYMLNNFDINVLSILINHKNIFVIIFWSLYFVLCVYLLIKKYMKNEKLLKYLLFITVGLSANLVMIVVPIWGGRTTLFTTIFLTLAYLYIFDDLVPEKIKNKLNKGLFLVIPVICLVYLTLYYNVYRFNIFQEESIKEQLKNKVDKEIVIYTLPKKITWGLIPEDDYHIQTYKKYYKIDEDVKLVFKNTKWKYKIIFFREGL